VFLRCCVPFVRVSAQEERLRKFLQNYAGPALSDADKTTRYSAAFVHLRDDDSQQVIIYFIGGEWCGSGGCTTLVLVPDGSSFTALTKLTVVQLPIRVLDSKSNGWHDLGVWVQGGDSERLRGRAVIQRQEISEQPHGVSCPATDGQRERKHRCAQVRDGRATRRRETSTGLLMEGVNRSVPKSSQGRWPNVAVRRNGSTCLGDTLA
jgi:hypothetical protein